MSTRSVILLICFGVVWSILLLRLFFMQIIQSGQYLARAEDNRVQVIDQIPARGLIYDRYGNLIVENQPTFSVRLTPAEFDTTSEEEFQYLGDKLNMTVGEVKEKLIGVWPFTPVTIKENVDFTVIAQLEEEKERHKGVDYKVDIRRIYAQNITMPHIIGYLNQITENRISYYRSGDYVDTDYKIGEEVGANGLEKFYEIELRGQKGYHQLEVNAKGKVMKDLGTNKHPKDGYNMYLSVDLDFQKYIEDLMGQQKGSIVVLDTRTGEVLAAVSKPDFNIMWFVNGIDQETWKSLNENPDKPMFNRIVQAGYAPGSTFKMITAIAGLEEGEITPNTYFQCKGTFYLGGNRFRCWQVKGHGAVNLEYALTQSCDVYFYNLAWKLGINTLAKYGRMFGLGQETGIDLPNERAGVMPTTEYFDKRYGKNNWKQGSVVNLGIGQGEIVVTPIQLVQYCTMLANSGIYRQPHFVRYVEDEDGIRKVNYGAEHVPVKQENFELIRKAMWNVVNAYAGTGKRAAIKYAPVAGKTGTAENVHGKVGTNTIGYHGWFIGFVPFDDPEIAVAVLMENGGEGSDVAAPMSAKVMSYYFSNVRSKKPFDPALLSEKKFQTLIRKTAFKTFSTFPAKVDSSSRRDSAAVPADSSAVLGVPQP